MPDKKITVEIDASHTFEVDSPGSRDPLTEARSILDGASVVERREDGNFTVHPVSRITAVYIGEVPSRQVGFPTVPRM